MEPNTRETSFESLQIQPSGVTDIHTQARQCTVKAVVVGVSVTGIVVIVLVGVYLGLTGTVRVSSSRNKPVGVPQAAGTRHAGMLHGLPGT